MKTKVFFVVGSARSGTTSLAKVLDTANNGICAIEPSPNLASETREMMDGRMVSEPMDVLSATVFPRVQEMLKSTEVYGEKNVTYAPFIPFLYQELECKFVFIKRDGRDVVRSLVNWHEQKHGNIYRDCRELGNISVEAIAAAASTPIHLDIMDYSRPRPQLGSPFYLEWEHFSRMEMCAYYWSFINELHLSQLEQLPADSWISIDYTRPSTKDVGDVFEFLGLSGFQQTEVQAMLNQRLNSNAERGVPSGTFPRWQDWDGRLRKNFDRIAAQTMSRLGYYTPQKYWRPDGYGDFWKNHEGGINWYTWMYNSRRKAHQDLVKWVALRDQSGDSIESIADFGCGMGVGYSKDFSSKQYTGVDLSERNIHWAQGNRHNQRHKYLVSDFVTEPLDEKADLVFSSGTIDNTYDIEQFIKSMVANSRKWIYFNAYRGWFPDIIDHQYSYSDDHKCFYNYLSPSKLREQLETLGCSEISIVPAYTENEEIPFETLVIARVPDETV